jgi:hypothetical protein
MRGGRRLRHEDAQHDPARRGELTGTNAEDPQLGWSDVPFARKVVGSSWPYQQEDATYQRLATLEELDDRWKAASTGPTRDSAAAKQLQHDNGSQLALVKSGRQLRKQLGEMRSEQRAIVASDKLSVTEKRAKTDRLQERRQAVMTAWNRQFIAAQNRDSLKSQSP